MKTERRSNQERGEGGFEQSDKGLKGAAVEAIFGMRTFYIAPRVNQAIDLGAERRILLPRLIAHASGFCVQCLRQGEGEKDHLNTISQQDPSPIRASEPHLPSDRSVSGARREAWVGDSPEP